VNDTTGPEIIMASVLTDEQGNQTLRIAMNEPVEQCRVGNADLPFEQMGRLEGCGIALGYGFSDWAPPGATTCELALEGAAAPHMVQCKDPAGNVGQAVEFTEEQTLSAEALGPSEQVI
jgi:hypothetical protein